MLAFHASDSGSNPDISTLFPDFLKLLKYSECYFVFGVFQKKKLFFQKPCRKPVAAGDSFEHNALAECINRDACRRIKVL